MTVFLASYIISSFQDCCTVLSVRKVGNIVWLWFSGEYKKDEILESARSGNEEKMMTLLTPLNVNCHASDGRKASFVCEYWTGMQRCQLGCQAHI